MTQLRAWTEREWSNFRMSREGAAYYLAGMIDGEGCVYIGGRRGQKKCIQISNTAWDLIESTIKACEILGIRYSISEQKKTPPWSDAYTVMISGRFELERVLDLVPIQSDRKYRKLVQAVESYRGRETRSGFIRAKPEAVAKVVNRLRRKYAMKQLEDHLRSLDAPGAGRQAAEALEGIL